MYPDRAPAGCRFWQDAADRSFATAAADHSSCAIGVYTHNLAPSAPQQSDLMDALKVFGDLGYVRPADLALIPVLKERHEFVIYSPLSETIAPPDVVILFLDARQALVAAEAAQQVENLNPPAMGRPACAVVPQIMNTGRAALSMGCCGARAYLDTFRDDVAIFGLPGKNLGAYCERIEALAKANAILSKFHRIRRDEIAAGGSPTVQDSIAALQSA
jgi:uncharacterized protein (DUF169 family)